MSAYKNNPNALGIKPFNLRESIYQELYEKITGSEPYS
jgi:hypothetical protein